jgi:hypothetical protein
MGTTRMAITRKVFKSPKHKIFGMLIAGRAKWKAKHHEVKKMLKLAGNQIRAVTKSRENWRARAVEAERQLRGVRADLKKTALPK